MSTFKPKDFAERIGVSVSTLQRWDREGILPAKRTPTDRRYYTQEDVENYFRSTNKSHDARWIDVDGFKHKCSCCGAVYDYDDNYCGHCGARMVWDTNELDSLHSKKEKLTDE